MLKLIERNPLNRLGASGGFEEVSQHPWFSDLDWKDVSRKRTYLKVPPEYKSKKNKAIDIN